MILLHVEPNQPPMSQEDFIATKPPFSIALDGYVATGPWFANTEHGPYANFNHHEGVSRLETRATCAQVLIAIRMGLFETFKDKHGNPHAHLYVNDCDHDVSLTNALFKNGHLSFNIMNPRLNQLVAMEDYLDTTAGVYAFPTYLESMQEMNWVFEPYNLLRMTGGIDRRNADEFKLVITAIEQRVMAYLMSKAEKLPLDTRYETKQAYPSGWHLVEEIGANARSKMFQDGINAFVSVRQRPDGRYTYSIGRKSLYIPFPIDSILTTLNETEGATDDRWGGAPTIAGSPRVGGSALGPDRVAEIINEILIKQRLNTEVLV